MPLHDYSLRLRRTICGFVLLALVLAQTLGALHRVVHAPLALRTSAAVGALQAPVVALDGLIEESSANRSSSATRDRIKSVDAPPWRSASGSWLALFGGHTSEQGCDLFDQLSHADPVPAAGVVMPGPTPVASGESACRAPVVALRPVASHARGPPLLG